MFTDHIRKLLCSYYILTYGKRLIRNSKNSKNILNVCY